LEMKPCTKAGRSVFATSLPGNVGGILAHAGSGLGFGIVCILPTTWISPTLLRHATIVMDTIGRRNGAAIGPAATTASPAQKRRVGRPEQLDTDP
jgi:hypothetical protein